MKRRVKGLEALAQPTNSRLGILTDEDMEFIRDPYNNESPFGFGKRLIQWNEKIKELYEENK